MAPGVTRSVARAAHIGVKGIFPAQGAPHFQGAFHNEVAHLRGPCRVDDLAIIAAGGKVALSRRHAAVHGKCCAGLAQAVARLHRELDDAACISRGERAARHGA